MVEAATQAVIVAAAATPAAAAINANGPAYTTEPARPQRGTRTPAWG